jgi:hypothetical protein
VQNQTFDTKTANEIGDFIGGAIRGEVPSFNDVTLSLII